MKKRNDNLGQLIVDHWRGQFSQGAAFWGVALLSVMAMKTLSELLPIFNTIQDQVLSTRLWLALTALALLLWLPWAMIGALRSILLHSFKLGHATAGIWLMGCWLLLAVYSVNEIYKDIPGLLRMTEIAFHQEEDKTEFSLQGKQLLVSGELGYGSYKQFKALLNNSPGVEQVVFDLQAAHLHEARQFAKLIAARQINTHVDNSCFGNCMLAFVGGYKRSASMDAEFRFYQYLNYVNGYRNNWIIKREQIKDRDYFVARGVALAFAYKLYYVYPNNIAFVPTLEELRHGQYLNVRLASGL